MQRKFFAVLSKPTCPQIIWNHEFWCRKIQNTIVLCTILISSFGIFAGPAGYSMLAVHLPAEKPNLLMIFPPFVSFVILNGFQRNGMKTWKLSTEKGKLSSTNFRGTVLWCDILTLGEFFYDCGNLTAQEKLYHAAEQWNLNTAIKEICRLTSTVRNEMR